MKMLIYNLYCANLLNFQYWNSFEDDLNINPGEDTGLLLQSSATMEID